jgi:C_GCAxxG_C_C family probable redox protein
MEDKRSLLAGERFDNGLNCAQAVLTAFSDELKMDEPALLRLGAGFGGGMARQQMTCGAVTGAYMVIGMMLDPADPNPSLKEKARTGCQLFSDRFLTMHKSLLCRELLGHDMNTDEGRMQIDLHDLFSTVCTSCVKDAVNIVGQILTETKPPRNP